MKKVVGKSLCLETEEICAFRYMACGHQEHLSTLMNSCLAACSCICLINACTGAALTDECEMAMVVVWR